MPHKINECWLAIATNEETGDESVPAIFNPTLGTWMPLVGTRSLLSLDELKAMAQTVATETGHSLELVHFTVREKIDTYVGTPKPPKPGMN